MNKLTETLRKIYRRPERPELWAGGGNLPWSDLAFSERMLREHLDESHGAASRVERERLLQVDWLWQKLKLSPGSHLFDITCGPGLYAVEFAGRGCNVTGVDFSPASIAYAKDLATTAGLSQQCTFVEQDVRRMDYSGSNFEAALFLYGQLAVFEPETAKALLAQIAKSLQPGGKLCLELLNQDRVDKSESNWWFTDDKGLWGEAPFLHLGERFWDAETETSIERFHTIDLETGSLTEIHLCDQTYSAPAMRDLLKQAGFNTVQVFEAWDGLPLYDAGEWVVYLAEKE